MNRHERRAAARTKQPIAHAPDGLPIFKIEGKPIGETTEQKRRRLGLSDAAGIFADAAVALNRDGCYYAARSAVKRALGLCPDNAFLLNILGMVVWNLGDYPQAAEALLRSVELEPADYQPHANLGTVFNSMGHLEQSMKHFAWALDLKPGDEHTRWERAMALLSNGRWQDGFHEYEVRFDFRGAAVYPKFPYPVWEGQDLTDKTLYVQGEQGMGDRILFSRYLAWIHRKWPSAKIIFLASPMADKGPALEPLLWHYRELGVEFMPSHIPWPKADYGIYLMSLPRVHGTHPHNVPPDPGLIRARVADQVGAVQLPSSITPAINVGIAWTGSPEMGRNPERSVPMRFLLELAENPDVMLHSLQFNDVTGQYEGLGARALITDLVPEIAPRGMVGTASVMVNLDLVITCCTSVAHLAGALGVPCWVLLNHDPYWVWLRESSETPWYPSVRLFRQPTPNDWRSVMDSVKEALARHARGVLENR